VSTSPGLLVRLAADLDDAGVEWAVLDEELDAVTLLVARECATPAVESLDRCGFAPLRRGHLAVDPAGRWLRVDVATELRFGPGGALAAGGAAGCLRRRRREGDLWRLDACDAFWVAVVRAVLDRHAPFPVRPAGITPAALAGAPVLADLGPLLPRDAHEAVRFVDAGDDRLRPGRLASTLRALRHDPSAVLRPVTQRGLTVALLGPDGAGKSTVAAGMVADYPLPARLVYMGMWQGADRPDRTRLDAVVAILVRPLKAGWRAAVAAAHVARGRLVVFDRYTYDALLPVTGPLAGLKRPYFWVLAHTAPRPDLVLVLDLPGEVAFARKGESTPEELETVRRGFLALAPRVGAEVVDGAGPPEQVRADVTARVWRRHRERLTGVRPSGGVDHRQRRPQAGEVQHPGER
jgi:thymidylate kinase